MTAWLAVGLLTVLVAAVATVAVVRSRRVIADVEGGSMEPTLYAGDRLLVRRGTSGLCAGRIVVVEQPFAGQGWWRPGGRRPAVGWRRGAGVWGVKRVVAVAGDPVPYERVPALGGEPGALVPAGKLVVLGDNPAASYDSRTYGYVPVDRVLGVMLRVLPSTGTGPRRVNGDRAVRMPSAGEPHG